jgi:hypothetical protein
MPAVGVSAHSNKDHADDADEDQRGDKATAERDPWMGERIGDDSGDLLPYWRFPGAFSGKIITVK